MAVLNCAFQSEVLGKYENFNAIIPKGCENGAKTLYLLHGLSDSYIGWLKNTCIERYATEHNIAVIMPDGARSFYTDMAHGGRYFTYISEEIVDYSRKLFGLSEKREDTFIAGLSMGGYGACKLAMRRNDVFCAAAILSGAIEVDDFTKNHLDEQEAINIFGENRDFTQSLENPFYLAKNIKGLKPRIYHACGTEDFLYHENQKFKALMETLDFDYKYEESPGIHSWVFWDSYIQNALDFMLS